MFYHFGEDHRFEKRTTSMQICMYKCVFVKLMAFSASALGNHQTVTRTIRAENERRAQYGQRIAITSSHLARLIITSTCSLADNVHLIQNKVAPEHDNQHRGLFHRRAINWSTQPTTNTAGVHRKRPFVDGYLRPSPSVRFVLPEMAARSRSSVVD